MNVVIMAITCLKSSLDSDLAGKLNGLRHVVSACSRLIVHVALT